MEDQALDVEIGKNITVGSSNVEIGEALTERARKEMVDLASKYFGKLTTAAIHFSREGHLFRCSANLRAGGVAMVSAESQHKDAHGALDGTIEKLRAQLSRLKRERRDEKHGADPAAH